MNNEKDTIITEDTISLMFDGGKEVECDILAIFPVKVKFYILLFFFTPLDPWEVGWRVSSLSFFDGENVELSDIESEEELNDIKKKGGGGG